MNKVVSIRLSDDMLNTTNKLISFKIVNSRTDAINYIMEHGINNVNNVIKKKEKTQELLEKYLKEGLPELPAGLSEKSILERE
ncbi:hypothetical protein ACLIKE_09735 [Ferroplasma acidiphilum]|uniref:VapB-type antitoxin n=1 Tax=Ferroplasma acidiphilum TaxID=74969 RepID=A0A1V0N5I7_9ARCH|nr:hypothetical protein [Ferroplasma acidiphilum]ARD85349.1 VapB-type antitoxin [Ferroplasma acidiphilum]NOL60733.1 hypothetical protein [Ferroplasma acidiphilum]WMT52458.1 MAG: hypothetical protein RE473_05435 [Ferroplasma acidiphilum]